MQVKRRINQFFENIRRKDKKLEQEESPSSSSRPKKKWKGKSSQNYSQWDLVEHMAEEPSDDEVIFSTVQLKLDLPNEADSIEGLHRQEGDGDDLICGIESPQPKESFLKRSGSLLRRSITRKGKKENRKKLNDSIMGTQSESLTNVVQQINETLNAVATFGGEVSKEDQRQEDELEAPHDQIVSCNVQVEPSPDLESKQKEECGGDCFDVQKKNGRVSLKVGLRRQASILVSKFQRMPGSLRLKPSSSIESVHNGTLGRKQRSTSVSGTESRCNSEVKENDIDQRLERKPGSFKRKMSFKNAKKLMNKGVSSFGKNMMHASAVMPIAYESPPASFYPDYVYDDGHEYPSELVQCYYRTLSYQPKDNNDQYLSDKVGGLHGQQTTHRKPTSFYQHGFCYNG